MSKQVLIFLLAIIFGLFTYAGYKNVVVTDSEITQEIQETHKLANELSVAYVWYDITIGDIMARYASGPIPKDEMIAQIEIEKGICHNHLVTYAKSCKSYEVTSMSILYSQDSIIDESINNIINSSDDTAALDAKITALYNKTRSILETLNSIMVTRLRYMDCLNDNIQRDNAHIRGYLINTWTMTLVLFVASFMKLKNLKSPYHPHKPHKKPVVTTI